MSKVPEKESAAAIEGTASQSTVPSSPYSGIDRKISEEDLQSPAVQRILLGEVDKLESKVLHLDSYVERFHATDKNAAILEEKLKAATSGEVLYSFCLAVGSVIIGLSASLWQSEYGLIAISIGFALWVGAIASQVIKWRS